MDAGSRALAERVATLEAALAGAEARASAAEARAVSSEALIAHLRLQIQKLNHDRFGPHSERSRRLLDQMELQLEELEASATEDELMAEAAAARTTTVAGFSRKRPSRKPFPEHLPPGCCQAEANISPVWS
jgi:transposase